MLVLIAMDTGPITPPVPTALAVAPTTSARSTTLTSSTTSSSNTTSTSSSSSRGSGSTGEPITHLEPLTTGLMGILVAITVILVGVVVVYARRGRLRPKAEDMPAVRDITHAQDGGRTSITRAWLALALVSGLLLFCVTAFALDDSQLRSTLFGGLVASVGSAVGFYFSSSSADRARQDILSALNPKAMVPDLKTRSVAEATSLAQSVGLHVVAHPQGTTTGTVTQQSPDAGVAARPGDTVHVDVQ